MSKIYQVEFFDTIKKLLCKGDEHDKTYFDFNTYTLKSTNQFSIIEQYGTIKEKGLYALIRISAVIKVGKLAGFRIALGDTRIRGNVIGMLKNKAKELRGETKVFAFSVDTRRECPEATYSKISNWILLKLEENNELYNLALQNKEEFKKLLSSLLNFAEQEKKANKEITKQNLLSAIDRGISGFNTIDKAVLNKVKNVLVSAGIINTIPIIGQIIALAPVIIAITNILLGGVETMKGTYKAEIFDIIGYQISQSQQQTQTTQTKQPTTQTSTTTTTSSTPSTTQTTSTSTTPTTTFTQATQQPTTGTPKGINPLIFVLIGVSVLVILGIGFFMFMRKRKA